MLATYADSQATSDLAVTMNRAPWGGSLAVSPSCDTVADPCWAATTEITLTARGWIDPGDGPLTYSFSYRRIGGNASAAAAAKQLTSGALSATTATEMAQGNWSMLCSVADT